MLNKLRLLSLLFIAWLFLHCLWVVKDGFHEFTGQADVAIILGNTVFADGTLSPWLQGRVDEALRLYRNRQVHKLFVSGGIGKTRYPEGDGMRNYLVAKGVPTEDIIVDNEGDNSYLTARNFQSLNKQGEFQTAVIVTSYYHVTRTKYIVKKLGMEEVEGASSKFMTFADWYGLLREFPAYYKYRLVY
ncbi:YdcF family protein [Paraflavitalea sp. CAU 1676]|uniref:YdcF family protein n=1 Tax=Paraflavitalea sp. CAU 1676 TaxID=3032598 RepID=UPI0023DAF63B|nr:YdcF family protein [Paraflavitalea sp. CAU 1676]MDF2188796.1 YdcF family protein [Paraflavitalea sp. CAU 1676]